MSISTSLTKKSLRRLKRTPANPSSHNHYDRAGIDYGHHRIIPYLHFYRDKEFVDQIISDMIEGSVFIYMASGTNQNDELLKLKCLKYNNILCVDIFHPNYQVIALSSNQRMILLPLDAIIAIQIFNQLKLNIDGYMCQNEGLAFGNGNYVILSDLLTSMMMPLFSDRIVIFSSVQYLKQNAAYSVVKNFLRLPNFDKKPLKTPEELFNEGIDFNLNNLTNYEHSSAPVEATLFIRKGREIPTSFIYNGVKINLIHGNIWDDNHSAKFLIYKGVYQSNLFRRNEPSVFDKRGSYVFQNETYDLNIPTDIVRMANVYDLNHLAFIPFGCQDYKKFIDDLTGCESSIQEISFYHFHATDYKELYKLFIV